jgi:hypothetical protein
LFLRFGIKQINPLAPGCDDRGKPQIESLAGRPACCVYFFLKKKKNRRRRVLDLE